MEKEKQVEEFKFGKLSKGDWYFKFRPNEGFEFDVETITSLMERCIDISKGERFCMLVDAKRFIKATPEARAHAAKAGYNRFIISRAIVTDSLPIKISANFFIRFNKPVVPTRVFTSEKVALDWLEKKYRSVNLS